MKVDGISRKTNFNRKTNIVHLVMALVVLKEHVDEDSIIGNEQNCFSMSVIIFVTKQKISSLFMDEVFTDDIILSVETSSVKSDENYYRRK